MEIAENEKTILAYVPADYDVKGSFYKLRDLLFLAMPKTGFPVLVIMEGLLLNKKNLSKSKCPLHQFQDYHEKQGIDCYVLQKLIIGDNIMKFN